MKVAYITAGAAGMYCGSCMHDNTLTHSLRQKGVNIILIPTYTPVRTDETDMSMHRVFFGGINVFLQQKFSLFRHTPRFIDRLFEAPFLLRLVSKLGSSTKSEDLGALTCSMLQGEHGHQKKELMNLVQWLKDDFKPDLVQLTNSMFAGFAATIKKELGVPVLCSLQGEELFLDALVQPYHDQARELLYQKAADIDGFVVNSKFYRDQMSDYLKAPKEKFHIVELGINLKEFGQNERMDKEHPFTVGYLARICPEKGTHIAVTAFKQVVDKLGKDNVRFRIAGYLGPNDTAFWKEQEKLIADWGLSDIIRYEGEVDREQKSRLLSEIDAFTVPAPYKEPKGLYVLEALAHGVPVVQPEHGSFPETLAHTGGGYLVEPNSPKSLAEGLMRVYENRDEARGKGTKGREVVIRDYNEESMADKTLAVYQNFVKG